MPANIFVSRSTKRSCIGFHGGTLANTGTPSISVQTWSGNRISCTLIWGGELKVMSRDCEFITSVRTDLRSTVKILTRNTLTIHENQRTKEAKSLYVKTVFSTM